MLDAADITKTLDLYFDALHEGDIWKLKQAFHPNTHPYSATGDEFVDLSLEEMHATGRRKAIAAVARTYRQDSTDRSVRA